MFKVNNRNTRKRCEICSKLTVKTPEQRYWHLFSVSIVDFKQVNLSWVESFYNIKFAAPSSAFSFSYLESLNLRANIEAVLIAIEIFCGIINYVKLRC